MPITRDFTVAIHDERDFRGFLPTWFSNADPTTGNGVAHDMLEHFRSQVGPVEGELAAFGTLILIRMEQGALVHSVYSEKETLAFDIRDVLRDLCYEGLPVPALKTSHPLAFESDWAEQLIVEAVPLAIEHIKGELANDGVLGAYEHLLTPEMARTYVAWIRHGYRQAQRRYQNVDLYYLGNYFFKKVQKKLEQLLHSDMLALGDQVRVALDVRRHTIAVKVNGRDADDYGYL